MTTLRVRMLGLLQAEVVGHQILDLQTNKVRGLLAYLAIETDQPARRETLAGMFWPEFTESRARANLSQALFTLRRCIGDDSAKNPLLKINRDTIQFSPGQGLWVDAVVFADGVISNKHASTPAMIRQLDAAAALYNGEFLESFSLSGCPSFEIWCLTQRERLHRLMSDALTQLIHFYERDAGYEAALAYAARVVALDGWREEAHVAMMRLLALGGRRSEALAQYETCRRTLADHLGISPMRQTTALYETIRDERLMEVDLDNRTVTDLPTLTPAFMDAKTVTPTPLICVGRDRELTRLEQKLADAVSGQGQAAFIAGEAGSGKSVLWQTFIRQAMDRYPQLLVASGKGTAYTGLGDPYAAFREIISYLTGDIATQWAAGTMARAQALRLWHALPFVTKILVRDTPGLIGTFVDGPNLLERAMAYAREARLNRQQTHWLDQLEELVASGAAGAGSAGQQQTALFEQFLRFLTAVARRAPLLLVLDDLQWADLGTIGLLFHISRNLSGQRLFLLGTYRPEEIALIQDGRRHPLQPVVHEIQYEFGDVFLELGQRADPEFVEAFIDNEPNNLDEPFRTQLFKLTGGHPLYTAELLRGLQERGDLGKDAHGRWAAKTELDWDTLPPRVEGVIAERIGRLPADAKQLLEGACVQGETFIAEVAAEALGTDKTAVASALSNELSRDHRLVRAQRLEHAGAGRGRLSTYQFHHFLFHKYLYDHLDPVKKAHLHEATGKALAARFPQADQASEMSLQLARHFEAAGILDKAVWYRLQAGNYAIKLAANDEAAAHFLRGLTLLESAAATPERNRQALALQLGLGTALQLKEGYGSTEAQHAYSQALDLCGQVGESPQLVAALWPLATYAAMVGNLGQALALAEQALAIAQRYEDPFYIAVAHHHVGWIFGHLGRFVESIAHQDIVIGLYERKYHEAMIQMFGHDFGITSLGWSGPPLCNIGFPDQALQRCHEAIALAQEFDHPFSLVHAYTMTAQTHWVRGELARAGDFGERIMTLAETYGFSTYIAGAHGFLGCARVASGQFAQGLMHMRKSLDLFAAGGVKLYHRGTLVAVISLFTQLGQFKEANDALVEADTIGFRDHADPLIETVRGQLLAAQGHASEDVEALFLDAIQVSQKREARWYELQTTMSLCQLWQAQGRQEEAQERLAAVYDWFTEGFDTPILQAAAAQLAELGQQRENVKQKT